jgi:hypothetical protein
MVLGVFLLRDSGFDHFRDAAGDKREGEDYRQVFHGSVFSPGRGESQCPSGTHAQVRSDFCRSPENQASHFVPNPTDSIITKVVFLHHRDCVNCDFGYSSDPSRANTAPHKRK